MEALAPVDAEIQLRRSVAVPLDALGRNTRSIVRRTSGGPIIWSLRIIWFEWGSTVCETPKLTELNVTTKVHIESEVKF